MSEGIFAKSVRAVMRYNHRNIHENVQCRKKDDWRTYYCDLYDSRNDIAYEIKSSKQDLNTGYGMNWIGSKNYVICPPEVVFDAKKRLDELGFGFVGIIAWKSEQRFIEITNPTEYLMEQPKWMIIKEARNI